MPNFINEVKANMNDSRNHTRYGSMTLINTRALVELVHHFESLDSEARARADDKGRSSPAACLVHEVQAAFHNVGVEETLDLVMFTIAELRKRQIKQVREADLKTSKARRFIVTSHKV